MADPPKWVTSLMDCPFSLSNAPRRGIKMHYLDSLSMEKNIGTRVLISRVFFCQSSISHIFCLLNESLNQCKIFFCFSLLCTASWHINTLHYFTEVWIRSSGLVFQFQKIFFLILQSFCLNPRFFWFFSSKWKLFFLFRL